MLDYRPKTITVELSKESSIVDGKKQKTGISYNQENMDRKDHGHAESLFNKFRTENPSFETFTFDTKMGPVELVVTHPLTRDIEIETPVSVGGYIALFIIAGEKAKDLVELLTMRKDTLFESAEERVYGNIPPFN